MRFRTQGARNPTARSLCARSAVRWETDLNCQNYKKQQTKLKLVLLECPYPVCKALPCVTLLWHRFAFLIARLLTHSVAEVLVCMLYKCIY